MVRSTSIVGLSVTFTRMRCSGVRYDIQPPCSNAFCMHQLIISLPRCLGDCAHPSWMQTDDHECSLADAPHCAGPLPATKPTRCNITPGSATCYMLQVVMGNGRMDDQAASHEFAALHGSWDVYKSWCSAALTVRKHKQGHGGKGGVQNQYVHALTLPAFLDLRTSQARREGWSIVRPSCPCCSH